MKKIWLTSDTHFSHKKLIDLGRPANFEQRIWEGLLERVKPGDTLIHLGDFCIGQDHYNHLLFQNNFSQVQKILVRGNHDSKSYAWYLDHGWDWVCDSMTLRRMKKTVLLTHMPIKYQKLNQIGYWSPNHAIDYNIHGHFHGNNHRRKSNDLYNHAFHYDVAPDRHAWKPILLDTVIRIQTGTYGQKEK